MSTDVHSKLYAYELRRRHASGDAEKLAGTLLDAQVDLNPHQVAAALFAFQSPLSKGAILADEVELGKTIEAGLLLSQRWTEGARRWKSEWVFPSRGKPLSTNGMAYHLKGTGFTVHGFRSSFRDWVGEANQDTIAAEMVLAHTVGNDVERSYARSELLLRKRNLLCAWNDAFAIAI